MFLQDFSILAPISNIGDVGHRQRNALYNCSFIFNFRHIKNRYYDSCIMLEYISTYINNMGITCNVIYLYFARNWLKTRDYIR